MEVDRISFAPRLLEMLEDMANCAFVAIDFEFSGIATKLAHATGKQTVQERYRETKQAAERYQILQIGLAFAIYDEESQRYTVKPYNMNLNPLLDEKLDIERIFSFQSGAVEFLLRHGFSLEEPFRNGVPYLSRDEAKKAKELAYNRLSRKNIEDIPISHEEVQALAFLESLRKVIVTWKEKGYHELEIASRADVCNQPALATNGTPTEDPPVSSEQQTGLSRFEKRLVHQLVRAEYPDLVTISGRESVRIIHLDEEREAEHLRKRKERVKEQINRQIGFRWIVEALLGNSLHHVDVRSFAFDPQTGIPRFVDLRALQSRFDQACASIKRKRIPLVGHNMFTDLIYFYQTFIGTLPDSVDEFAAEIHRSFPMIVDTKYLATHNCGDINPASSLQEIEAKLRLQERPIVETHSNHTRYLGKEAFHEAGYDSYLTALVAIRLSTKLEHERSHVEEVKQGAKREKESGTGITSVIKSVIGGGVSLIVPSSHNTSSLNNTAPVDNNKQTKAKAPPQGRFSSANVSERLGMLEIGEDSSSDTADARDNTADASSAHDAGRTQETVPPMTVMPAFSSDFWQVYGNKLRLFGTMENVLKLDDEA